MPADIINLDEHRPHAVSWLICTLCSHEFLGVYLATHAPPFQCPACLVDGAAVLSGRPLDNRTS